MAATRKQTNQRKKRTSSAGSKKYKQEVQQQSAIKNEVVLIGVLAAAVLLFLCNFGVVGTVGNTISGVMFGLFGAMAYAAPVLVFLATAFGIANQGETVAKMKLAAGVVLFVLLGCIFELITGNLSGMEGYSLSELYLHSRDIKAGGGIICGSAAYLLYHFLDMVGTILVLLVLGIICAVIITEKSFVGGVKKSSKKVLESAKVESERRRERAERKKEEMALLKEQLEQERILRMDKKVSGVMLNTTLEEETKENTPANLVRDDIHEIILPEEELVDFTKVTIKTVNQEPPAAAIPSEAAEGDGMKEIHVPEEPVQIQESYSPGTVDLFADVPEPVTEKTHEDRKLTEKKGQPEKTEPQNIAADIKRQETNVPKKYSFPPISLLNKPDNKGAADTTKQLKETAVRLQQTLATFGVRVTITDISQGPSVTRYELQPEQGVKVSKIVGLTDDIKLNLAATDIRIEAPIPGKAAVGIEVPNKENTAVALRDLLERKEFKDFPSNLAFAVGKDISGQTIVSDIAKMPHMLIAGSTGSGKSVCINTLIMSILYKAHPDDVKLIMVDPKVVELSVYNGIPHLLIPVVTDPKKAAGALHWGVAEMTDRYQKFADYNVRDLKGYNKKIEGMKDEETGAPIPKMPQIVIIVDELADLMMVAPGEVEESICRLAQLARAAGIHLIIATQRPSVDVITGLIKANMPSRVAFAVSSGVDSRTILDMNGAEKLLGKGDMLFYPQGYPKPARIQGAFVSDKEVSDVVEFLKNQAIGNVYSEAVEEKIQNIGSSSAGMGDAASERDEYFIEAAKFVIDKDKGSIGMLQRVFKIGFNRAARIMDQLCEAGIVGEEEGTKPRKILMSMEELEQYIEEYF